MKTLRLIVATIAAASFVGCAPSGEQLKKAIEKDPSIVFVAIEKAPGQFIEVVNKAARKAQEDAQGKAAEDEKKKRDDEFANPLKPNIDESRVFMGPKDAKVTIVEYSDFECPYCNRGYLTMKQVLEKYPKDVRILFKHLPLDFHPKAMPAAQMFEAIAKQSHDKAIKFHDTIFQNQDNLRSGGEKWMKETAKKLGVDIKKMEQDMDSEDVKKRIAADVEEARQFEISGTPGFVINGVSLKGAYPLPEFQTIIDRHLGK